MIFDELLRNPDLCGGGCVSHLRVFVNGMRAVAIPHQQLERIEWRRLAAFESQYGQPKGSLDCFSAFTIERSLNEVDAFHEILNALLHVSPTSTLQPLVPLEAIQFSHVLRELVMRPGMYLYQPTSTHLYAYLRGYLWAAEHYRIPSAREDQTLISDFIDWYRAEWLGTDREFASWLHAMWFGSGVPGNALGVLNAMGEFLAQRETS